MVDHARRWIASPYPDVRLWAALILVRDGDTAHNEGLDTLEPLLEGPDAVDRYIQASPTMLASPSPRVRRLADALFPHIDPHIHTGNDLQLNWVFQLYFVDGRKECLDFLIKALDDYTPEPNTYNVSGDPIYCTDGLAFWLGTWGRGLIQSPAAPSSTGNIAPGSRNSSTPSSPLSSRANPPLFMRPGRTSMSNTCLRHPRVVTPLKKPPELRISVRAGLSLVIGASTMGSHR